MNHMSHKINIGKSFNQTPWFFTLSCVDIREIPQFNKMKIVLAKVAGLIKQV